MSNIKQKISHTQKYSMLESAYRLFQSGNISDSLETYQMVLKFYSHSHKHQQLLSPIANIDPSTISDIQLQANIVCTIAVLASSLAKYYYSQQIIEQFLRKYEQSVCNRGVKIQPNSLLSPITQLRIRVNLIVLKIINKEYQDAIQMIQKILIYVQCKASTRSSTLQPIHFNQQQPNLGKKVSNYNSGTQVLSYLTMILFRVDDISQLDNITERQIQQQLSLLEMYHYLNICFCQKLLKIGQPLKILKKLYMIRSAQNINGSINVYETELKVICLRQILSHHQELTLPEQSFYEGEISNIKSLFQLYQIDNNESIQCCSLIAQKIKIFYQQNNNHRHQTQNMNRFSNQSMIQQWKLVLSYFDKKLSLENVENNNDKISTLKSHISSLKKQTSLTIIREMMATNFYKKQLKSQFLGKMNENFIIKCESIKQKNVRLGFKNIIDYFQLSKKSLKETTTKSSNQDCSKSRKKLFTHNNSQKQGHIKRDSSISISSIRNNCAHEGTSHNSQSNFDYSLLPSISSSKTPPKQILSKTNNKGIDKITITGINFENNTPQKKKTSKFIAKILRYCECGSFLSKRNYNSNGGEYRFVRLTNAVIKWAKNPQKIEDDCQLYPLKDVKSIHYGKCTPILLKSSNNFLQSELCFSLHLQKRTLDFHCKDIQQAKNWVCGLTQKLKNINPKFKGYTHGKLLWIRMFMKLREEFTKNLRPHEKNYYYENAQAVVLFGKNGYKLNQEKHSENCAKNC